MVHRFRHGDGELARFDTDKSDLLMGTRTELGGGRTLEVQIYRTDKRNYISVSRTIQEPVPDAVRKIERPEVLEHLALAASYQRTEAGDDLLARGDPSEEI